MGVVCPLGEKCPATIACDRKQPGEKITVCVPTVKTAKNPQKSLLRDILGIDPVAQHPVTEPKDSPLVLLNQSKHGSAFSCKALFHQYGDGHRICASLV
jgi:hypothetical protein